ncbi:hypothetical protein VTJ04DRAFT_2965 [Mycothermus thermophilus]|uniref:uncharacterized protein n=1 Tax=Humicola insolens TaxID=85995 RepID=UPI0037432E3B
MYVPCCMPPLQAVVVVVVAEVVIERKIPLQKTDETKISPVRPGQIRAHYCKIEQDTKERKQNQMPPNAVVHIMLDMPEPCDDRMPRTLLSRRRCQVVKWLFVQVC